MNRYDNIPVRLDGDLVKSIDRLQLRSRINAGVRRFLNGQSHVTVAQRIMREKKRGHRINDGCVYVTLSPDVGNSLERYVNDADLSPAIAAAIRWWIQTQEKS